MKTANVVRALILGIAALSVWLGSAQSQVPDDRQMTSVFFLGVADPQKNYAVISYGTAFFIGSDGLAITASHVIFPFTHEPGRYALLALVGKEFYGASVVCAYPLPNAVQPSREVFYRDIAEVNVEAPRFPFRTWALVKDDPVLTYVPHEGPLPEFPPLWVASGAASGAVHIPGFGAASEIPRLHVSHGNVIRAFQSNGVPLIELSLVEPIQQGDSGAPVLSGQGSVIGIVGHPDPTSPSRAYGVSASVLANPCK
jgi:hypothetical protein